VEVLDLEMFENQLLVTHSAGEKSGKNNNLHFGLKQLIRTDET
jgi:hypothetical protein